MITIDDQEVLYAVDPEHREIARLPVLDRPFICCGVPNFSTDGALYSRPDRNGGTEVFDAAAGESVP